jgi:putative transposase
VFHPTHIILDRDSKFNAEFFRIPETDGIEFRPIPTHIPNLNPYVEVWVGSTKAECLNHFIVFGSEESPTLPELPHGLRTMNR